MILAIYEFVGNEVLIEENEKKINWEYMLIVHKDSVAEMKRTKTKHNLPTLFVVNNTKEWPYFERLFPLAFLRKNIYNLLFSFSIENDKFH